VRPPSTGPFRGERQLGIPAGVGTIGYLADMVEEMLALLTLLRRQMLPALT
jgi:hypothetical protein